MLLTFVIPVAPDHEAIVEQAIASIHAQTIPCGFVVVHDHDRRGAGYARNMGLAQVTTPFVSFLDADDTVDPDFAEKCLRAYDGQRYVYTDWIAVAYVEAPLCPWNGKGAAHIITTLLPTAFVRHVGGFDETLPGYEDTDFYWKLTRSGLCGKRLPEALFHYSKGGQRAEAFKNRPDRETLAQSIIGRYKGMAMSCGGCGTGNTSDYEAPPAGTPAPGDVLTTSLWQGNRVERGRATGRLYPRSGNGKRLWVAPADIDAAPHLFARVVEMPPRIAPERLDALKRQPNGDGALRTPPETAAVEAAPDDFAAIAERIRLSQRDVERFGVPVKPVPVAPDPPLPEAPAVIAPDVVRAQALYGRAAGI